MVFESLSEKLQGIVKKMKGKARVSENDIKEMMREVKLALLEADVNYKVVKDFVKVVSEKALGQDVLESLTPGQQVIKIVQDELKNLLGSTQSNLNIAPHGMTVIMMVGLQGSGKTTASGKLANYLRKQGKKVLLVACDVYRPAAIKQLEVIGNQLNIPVYKEENCKDVPKIAKNSLVHADLNKYDAVIIDTAGRLHVDDELMNELVETKKIIKPHEILLVIDSMIGQDSVNVAESFNNKIGIDGVILSKLDGDTRGGAALSIKTVTNKPIKFASVGEKMNDLEIFHPDRMASRILGMGDVLSLIEKAEENFDEKQAKELEEKIMSQQFNLEDFMEQFKKIKKLGSFSKLISMIPGMGDLKNQLPDDSVTEKVMTHYEAIINSMTPEERKKPDIINGSRKRRISSGSGTSIQDVNALLKSFEELKKMMKKFGNINGKKKKGMFGF